MRWDVLYRAVGIAICYLTFSPHLIAQKISFGAITGAQLTDDFRTLACPGLQVSQIIPPPRCPSVFGAAIIVSNASRRFIIGPKVTVDFSRSISLEVDALHREIRRHNTSTYLQCRPDQLPDCTMPVPMTHSSTGTDFTWEFPVLGKYQMSGGRIKPFMEAGPSFRPAENREQTAVTAGAGFELPLRTMRLSPSLRYSRWGYNGKYVGANRDQLQFVLGIDGPRSEEPVSAFGHRISLSVIAGLALTGALRTRTESFTNTLEIDPSTGRLVPVDGSVIVNSNRASPIIGFAISVTLPKQMSVEVGALYRPLNARDISTFSSGFSRERRFTVLTWEFPLLAKYKLPVLKTKPFVEFGPSFRASGNLNGARPSRQGITEGIGIELHERGPAITPILRFTHWAADPTRNGMATHPNQLELVVGLRF
jgi:hypothetical protein